MKLTMDTASLRSTVEWISRHIAAKPVTPILSAIVLEASADRLTAHAFDYDNWAEASAEAQIGVAGRVAVSGRLLRAVVDALPKNARVDLVAEDSAKVRIASGNLRASLPLMPVEDFPARPPMPEATLDLPLTVGRVLASALPMASDMEAHTPDAVGCALVLRPDGVEVVAADRYRMFASRLPWPEGAAPPADPVIIQLPARSVKALGEAAKTADRLRIGLPTDDTPMLTANAGGRILAVRLAAGRLPNYQQHLTLPPIQRALTVDTGDLLVLLKALAPLTESNEAHARIVRVEVGGGLLQATAVDAGTVADAVPAEHGPDWDNDPWEMAINATFLADVLTAADNDRVQMHFVSATKAIHITRPGSDLFHAVVMPIRLPQGATR